MSGALGGRSIPAWAGETRQNRILSNLRKVYPRVGGGNRPASCSDTPPYGLSPRGRGKHIFLPRPSENVRSIPAWAGETNTQATEEFLQKVYPRVGGGNQRAQPRGYRSGGLSPRGRGKPQRRSRGEKRPRSIPAWAGETSYRCAIARLCAVYPRVGGGNYSFIAFRMYS